MDYYNNIPPPSLDNNQDFEQMHGAQEDVLKMMEKMNLQNNEVLLILFQIII